jgi:hypothetical protein
LADTTQVTRTHARSAPLLAGRDRVALGHVAEIEAGDVQKDGFGLSSARYSADRVWSYASTSSLRKRARRFNEILGLPDDVKFRSSMALSDDPVFEQAIAKYFSGGKDQRCLISWQPVGRISAA